MGYPRFFFSFNLRLVRDNSPPEYTNKFKDYSELEKRLAIRAGRVGIWVWRLATGEVTWSDEIFEIYQFDRTVNPSFENWIARVHPEDQLRISEELRSAIRGERPYDSQFRIVWPEGDVRWIAAKGDLQRNADGQPATFLGINIDITDHVRADESHLALAAIVESSDDAIIGQSLDGTVTTWNFGAEQLFGFSAEEMIGQPLARLAWPGFEDEIPRILARIRRGERVRGFETFRRHKDGHKIPVSLTVSPVYNSAGVVVGASKIARDISERKRMEEELLLSNDELQQFAYAASHDLQEPLRNISAFSELLARQLEGRLGEEESQTLNVITEGAQRMSRLVSGLLDYSRLANQQGTWRTFSSSEAVEAAISNLRMHIDEKRATVTYQDLPFITADRPRLIAVFQNLISNAIKYNHCPNPEVRISAELTAEGHRFCVADNGIGIAPRHQDRIFKVFARLLPRKHAGTGIGLAICKRVIERHNGRIWVESQEGEGAKFFFTIPVGPTEVLAESRAEAAVINFEMS